jgi:hypothetical protein
VEKLLSKDVDKKLEHVLSIIEGPSLIAIKQELSNIHQQLGDFRKQYESGNIHEVDVSSKPSEPEDSTTGDKEMPGEARPSRKPGVVQRFKNWWKGNEKTKELLVDLKALGMSIDHV